MFDGVHTFIKFVCKYGSFSSKSGYTKYDFSHFGFRCPIWFPAGLFESWADYHDPYQIYDSEDFSELISSYFGLEHDIF